MSTRHRGHSQLLLATKGKIYRLFWISEAVGKQGLTTGMRLERKLRVHTPVNYTFLTTVTRSLDIRDSFMTVPIENHPHDCK